MEYKNTTDIPTDLVKVVIAFAGFKDITINKLELRNKEKHKFHANLGKYYLEEKKITLNVPPEIPSQGMLISLKHIHRTIRVNRIEFVVAVLAHELRHAWQFQVKGLEFLNCNRHCEFDAEQYEYLKLVEWQQITRTPNA